MKRGIFTLRSRHHISVNDIRADGHRFFTLQPHRKKTSASQVQTEKTRHIAIQNMPNNISKWQTG